MKWKCLLPLSAISSLLILYGCSALLPSAKEVVRVPWENFQQVHDSYNKVIPNETTVHQLRKLRFDIYSTPNVKNLNYLDIAQAAQYIKSEDLSPGLTKCIKARDNCRGYELEPKVTKRERVGNFWLDLLNFRRKTKQTGWRFKALFLVVDDIVVDKFWDGAPMISEEQVTKNPLGPLQDAAGGFLLRLF